MPHKGPVQQLVSAGGVVYRKVNGRVEIVLCGRQSPPVWALPKGTPGAGEALDQAALREVREETGLDVAIEAPLGSIQYWFMSGQDGVRCHKTVHYYLMVPTGGDFSRHDPEFDELCWCPEPEIFDTMTYHNEAAIVQKALVVAHSEAATS